MEGLVGYCVDTQPAKVDECQCQPQQRDHLAPVVLAEPASVTQN